MEKEVKIKIISKVYDISDCPADGKYPAQDEAQCDVIEMSAYGKMTLADGVYSIEYDECCEGMSGTKTRLFFDVDRPGCVSLFRRGTVCGDLVFDQEIGRSVFMYQNEIMPFEMALVTKRLVNRLGEDGGTLHLDYKIELQATNIERTVFDMLVKVV